MAEGLISIPGATGSNYTGFHQATPTSAPQCHHGFGSIAALPSNLRAIEASLLFSGGVQPFVCIVGPSGWGKTHLLTAVAKVLQRREFSMAKVMSAYEWASGQHRWEANVPVILDDVQDAWNQVRTRQNLRLGLEKRVKSGRPTLLALTSEPPHKAHRSNLPCLREWVVGTIDEPTPSEKELVTRQIASSKRMVVAPAIVSLLAKKTKGNGRSLEGALERLKLVQSDWLENSDVLRACGILVPYFEDGQGWDVRDHVHETICAVHGDLGARMSTRISAMLLSIFVMLCDVGIGEEEVASYFRLSPGATYAYAQQVAATLDCDETRALHAACLTALHRSIEQL